MRLLVLLALAWPLVASAASIEDAALTIETDWGTYCFFVWKGKTDGGDKEEGVGVLAYPNAGIPAYNPGLFLLRYNAAGFLTAIEVRGFSEQPLDLPVPIYVDSPYWGWDAGDCWTAVLVPDIDSYWQVGYSLDAWGGLHEWLPPSGLPGQCGSNYATAVRPSTWGHIKAHRAD